MRKKIKVSGLADRLDGLIGRFRTVPFGATLETDWEARAFELERDARALKESLEKALRELDEMELSRDHYKQEASRLAGTLGRISREMNDTSVTFQKTNNQ